MSKRVLLIRPGGIGDCILCFPAMEHLRGSYTEAWISTPVVPLVQFADRVESIVSSDLDRVGIVEADSVFERLKGFDRIVSWYGAKREDFRAAVTGLPFEFHSALPDTATVHAADFFASQVGLEVLPAIPRIPVSATRRRFVAAHPFSGSVKKNWAVADFEQIASSFGLPVEWCATSEQRPLLGNRPDVHCFDNLLDLARWLASAECYVGNDSGITHLAAAVGTPVSALFTEASNPLVWAPRSTATVRIIRSPR